MAGFLHFDLANYYSDQRWLKEVEDNDVSSHVSQNR